MLESYKAKVLGDRITWDGQAPAEAENGAEVDVIVTVLPHGARNIDKRPFGLAKGEFVVPDDFDAPLAEDTLSEFEN